MILNVIEMLECIQDHCAKYFQLYLHTWQVSIDVQLEVFYMYSFPKVSSSRIRSIRDGPEYPYALGYLVG